MGKAIFWILIVITAIFTAGIFWAGAVENNMLLGIILSFIAIISAAFADRQN